MRLTLCSWSNLDCPWIPKKGIFAPLGPQWTFSFQSWFTFSTALRWIPLESCHHPSSVALHPNKCIMCNASQVSIRCLLRPTTNPTTKAVDDDADHGSGVGATTPTIVAATALLMLLLINKVPLCHCNESKERSRQQQANSDNDKKEAETHPFSIHQEHTSRCTTKQRHLFVQNRSNEDSKLLLTTSTKQNKQWRRQQQLQEWWLHNDNAIDILR